MNSDQAAAAPDFRVNMLAPILANYVIDNPGEAHALTPFSEHLAAEPEGILDRSNMRGHVTASVLVLTWDQKKAYLVWHRSLGRWLQPGGHHDGPGGPLDNALREGTEEIGIAGLEALYQLPLDIDVHPIPPNPRKDEGEHLHYDILYLAVAPEGSQPVPALGEVEIVKEFELSELASEEGRIGRAARKALAWLSA